MSVKLNEKYLKKFITKDELKAIQPHVDVAANLLNTKTGEGNAFLGWADLPQNYDKAEFAAIKAAAEKIKKTCDILIVVGIGGSYLGARAVIEFIKSNRYNSLKKDTPDIYYAGNSLSAASLNDLLSICEGKDICINVISKSGTTTEPAVAFRILRGLLEEKYGKEGARERIFVTTDREKGTLKAFSDDCGYCTFVVPDDIGGRFSVLTAVGLLPIAVAGIDIDKLMEGANAARVALCDNDIEKNDCYKYAAIRNIMLRKGKDTEIFVTYEPFAQIFSEWWKQLYGESEGKDGKGIYPASVVFSTDLHSLGQYIQDGQRFIFETVLDIKDTGSKITIPNDENDIDGLNFLSGEDLNFVNRNAMKGTLIAHMDGNVPNVVIEVEKRDEFSLGYLIYFFEKACAISGYILGVNPFNQPGVEAYKKNMFALLGKPGYEKEKSIISERLK